MGLDDIKKAVLESAQTQAERIVQAATNHAATRVARLKDQGRHEAEREYENNVRAIDEEFNRKLIQFKGVASKQHLAKKNERLKDVFARAKRQILEWPEPEYAGVMRCLIERAAENTGGRLRVYPEEKTLFAALLAETNQDRDAARQLTIDEAAPLPAPGGFVFVGPDFEVDHTVDTILADIEHELAPTIAAGLFSD